MINYAWFGEASVGPLGEIRTIRNKKQEAKNQLFVP